MSLPQPPSSSGGGTELPQLIKSMSPTLDPTGSTYVFAQVPLTAPDVRNTKLVELILREHELGIKMLFQENEAWTVILRQDTAIRERMEFSFPCKMVTLNVHSSLEAVGFLAAVTTRLAERLKTGVNPVSGFFHDHLFVPEGLEEAVVEELKKMAAEESEM